jgi:polar amino acid transport system substrate-binding protein
MVLPLKSYSQSINNSNVLKVGLDEFPPWNMTTGQAMSGINVEIIEMLAQNMGLALEFSICPWKRCLKLMSAGKIDLLPGVLKKGDREDYMHFIAPAYKTQSNKVFYTLSSTSAISDKPAVTINSFGDLYSYSIGVVAGVKYFEAFDKSYQLDKVEVTGNKQLIAMLKRKRIDAFIGTESQIDYQLLKNGGYQGISKANYQYKKPTAVYLTLSKKSPHYKNAHLFDLQMSKMIEEGKADQIIQGFFKKLAPHGL